MSFPSGENPGTTQQTSIAHRNFDYYMPLYKAAPEGNWDSAKRLFEDDSCDQSARADSITCGGHWQALRIQDCGGYTALHHAAIVGSLRYAVALVRKNPSLMNVLDANGRTPLLVGSRYVYESNYNVLCACEYVQRRTGCPFTGPSFLIVGLLSFHYYRWVASLLSLLSATPSNFLSGSSRKLHTLELSWCRNLTDKELGFIVDRCLSLKVLKLFGCTQITDVFLNGHLNSEYLDLKLDTLGYSVCLSPEDENQLRNPKIA
ncbi:Ankyrin repeat-containing protein [Parasponia andersonii]|uniref:Ankyrin repeat-containing protein n=1 Tax=Parasponia andersonii TaxID=3476 RepID=A0A2P5AXM8_PARAD|nr:Ankyrin repeat-containing protein [Parasponia andersonii]